MARDLYSVFGLKRRRRPRRWWRAAAPLQQRLSGIATAAASLWQHRRLVIIGMSPLVFLLPPMVTYATTDWGWSLSWRHHVAYANCATARRVGLAPALIGHPGYWPKLDADSDGIACEPYPSRSSSWAPRPDRHAPRLPLAERDDPAMRR